MARPTVRLFLVRHGAVDANLEYRFLGRRDDPLNAGGVAQAERLAAVFAQLPVEAVHTSPLARARRTAEAIAVACGADVVVDEALVELDFGDWEGLTRDDVADPAELARWDADPARPAPGGESLLAVQERITRFADRILSSAPGTSLAAVTHMGPIKALVCAALDLPLTASRRLFLDPATISVVDWSSTPVVRLFNDHVHLGWAAARWLQRQPPSG